MTKHIGYALIGGVLFFGTTILVLWFSDNGIHESFSNAITNRSVFRSSLKASLWIGVLAGGITSITLRKSVNQKVYIWIALLFTLTVMELVIASLV